MCFSTGSPGHTAQVLRAHSTGNPGTQGTRTPDRRYHPERVSPSEQALPGMGVCSEVSVGARKQSAEVNHFLLSLSAKCNSLISITQGCCPRCSAGALFNNLKGCLFFWRALKLGKLQRVGDVCAGPAGLGAGGSRCCGSTGTHPGRPIVCWHRPLCSHPAC